LSIGRLLNACGWTETPLTTKPFDHIEHTQGTAVEASSAAYWLADKVEELFKGAFPDVVRRPGDLLFSPNALDAFAKAGCTLEDRVDGGVTIHLPNSGLAIEGRDIYQLMTEPLRAAEFVDMPAIKAGPPPAERPDYLRHDPTKRHSRKRPTTKRSKHR
jgi:hypothetical protein